MDTTPNVVLISIPRTEAREFERIWKELRLADGLSPEHDLKDAVEIENFDGAVLVQWLVDVTAAVAPIITGMFGFLIAARGEFEYEKGGEKIRIKNLKPSQIKEILEIIDSRRDA